MCTSLDSVKVNQTWIVYQLLQFALPLHGNGFHRVLNVFPDLQVQLGQTKELERLMLMICFCLPLPPGQWQRPLQSHP